MDFTKGYCLRVPVGESSIYQRLAEIIKALEKGERGLTDEDVSIAIEILQAEGIRPTIKEVARLLRIPARDLKLAQKKGSIKELDSLVVKDNLWIKFNILVLPVLFIFLGVFINNLPTAFTILLLPHELTHALIHMLKFPDEVLDKLVINPVRDPLGVVQWIFSFVTVDANTPVDKVAEFLFKELEHPIVPFSMPARIGIILENFVPSVISAVQGWLAIFASYKIQRYLLLKSLFIGIGLYQLMYIGVFYPLGVISGWFFGDYIGGVGFILQLLDINVGVDVSFRAFHALILTSGACVLLTGYLAANWLINLTRYGIHKLKGILDHSYVGEAAKGLIPGRAIETSL